MIAELESTAAMFIQVVVGVLAMTGGGIIGHVAAAYNQATASTLSDFTGRLLVAAAAFVLVVPMLFAGIGTLDPWWLVPVVFVIFAPTGGLIGAMVTAAYLEFEKR